MAPVKEYSGHPLEIHQARCEPTSGNLHFSAPPFWHLTTFGWPHKWLATQVFFSGRGLMLHFEPFQTFSTPLSGSTGSQNEARAAQILQHIQGTWGILGNKNCKIPFGRFQAPALFKNKMSRPPTYMFHGPPPKTIAAKRAQKKWETTRISTIAPPRPSIQNPKTFSF